MFLDAGHQHNPRLIGSEPVMLRAIDLGQLSGSCAPCAPNPMRVLATLAWAGKARIPPNPPDTGAGEHNPLTLGQ